MGVSSDTRLKLIIEETDEDPGGEYRYRTKLEPHKEQFVKNDNTKQKTFLKLMV